MTKTESAEKLIKTLVIESCEQLLDFHGAEGVRAAIPNTNNLIMVGPDYWIAQHLPDVETMIANSKPILAEDDITAIWQTMPGGTAGWLKSFGFVQFARAIEAEVIDRLAATTQASTAQAERSDDSAEGLELLDSLIFNIDRSGNYSVEATLTFLGQIRQCFATSSTDAQAVAEVRDAALDEAALLCEQIGTDWLDADDAHKQFAADYLAKAIRALRAGDTGEQADGGAHA